MANSFQVDISILNTNTNSVLVETVSLDEYGGYDETGDYRIAGVAGTGSEVKVAFMNPAGTMTGRLLPTGNTQDTLSIRGRNCTAPFRVQATMIDAGNPFVLIDALTLPFSFDQTMLLQPDKMPLHTLNEIRCEASVAMGLATSTEQARLTPGTPKIALVLPPTEAARLFPQNSLLETDADVAVVSLSMGKLHPSLQLTGAVAVSSALSVEGTTASCVSRKASQTLPAGPLELQQKRRDMRIAHRSGCIDVTVKTSSRNSEVHVESCSVSRTARTLFEGQVLFHA